MFTREDDVLDVLVGVVCDADVHFDGLTMIVHLQTPRPQTEITSLLAKKG